MSFTWEQKNNSGCDVQQWVWSRPKHGVILKYFVSHLISILFKVPSCKTFLFWRFK